MNKFLAEILEQPDSLAATLEYYVGPGGQESLRKIRDLFQSGRFQEIIFTGMGSSYFASQVGCSLLNSLGIRSFVMNASELLYYHSSLIDPKTLLVCVSQSGESIEMVKLLEKLPEKIFFIAISNEEESSLSSGAGALLLTKAGREEMTSTKTYTSTILVMLILGWYLGGRWNDEKVGEIRKLVKDAVRLLSDFQEVVSGDFQFLGDIDFVQFIGRGPSFATALQSELMFKEAGRAAASGTLGGEFRHGPMEMVREGFKSVLFATRGKTYRQSIKMAADICKYGGKVIVIANNNPDVAAPCVRSHVIDQPDEHLFTIQSIIPVQLMVNELALSKGLVPGHFVNGGKVTLSE